MDSDIEIWNDIRWFVAALLAAYMVFVRPDLWWIYVVLPVCIYFLLRPWLTAPRD